jgi:hypothetical protein
MVRRSDWRRFILRHGFARRTRAFCADRKGTTAIEFAFVLVPFLGLLGAIFEVGFAHFRLAQLQTVTENASRLLLTNKPILAPGEMQITSKEFVERFICTWKSNGGTVERGTLDKMFDCDDVYVVLAVVNSLSRNAVMPQRLMGRNLPIPRLPGPGEIVVLKVFYRYRMLMSILALDGSGAITKITPSASFNINGRVYDSEDYALSAFAAFRVEPGG